jgi:hypothetical protein
MYIHKFNKISRLILQLDTLAGNLQHDVTVMITASLKLRRGPEIRQEATTFEPRVQRERITKSPHSCGNVQHLSL